MQDARCHWQLFAESLPDPVFRVDQGFQILFVNEPWSSITGISARRCLGHSLGEIGLPAETCRKFEEACRQVASTSRAAEFEHALSIAEEIRHFVTQVVPEADSQKVVTSFLAITRDITRRVRAESILAAGENPFQAFMDHSPGLFWIKDEAGRYIYMSRGCEEQHGIRFSECRNKTDLELWPYEIAKVYRENDLLVLSDGRTQQFVEKFEKPDGTLIHLLCHKFTFHDGQGTRYIGGWAIEITDRVQNEEALQERGLYLTALLETAAFVVLGMTADFRIFEWNRAAERIYGYSRDEVLGEDYLKKFLPEDVRPGVAAEIQALLAGRPTEGYINDVLHRDGTRRTLLWNACRLIDSQQKIHGLVAIGQDISDRIRIEQALRNSEFKYRQLLDNLHDVVWSVEVEHDAYQGQMTFISEQAEAMFGYSCEDFLNDPGIWVRRLHPDDLKSIQQGMRLLKQGAVNLHRAFRFRHGQTGEWLWIEDHVSAVHDDHGRLTELFGVARDVTERVQTEDALREKEFRLELALNASHAATWSWDAVTNVAVWDRRYHQHYELNADVRPSFEVWIGQVHPEDRERLTTRIAEMIKPGGGDIWHEEFRTIPLSHGIRWMEGIGCVERDASGRAVRFSGLNFDITDRKRAELAIRQSAMDMQALVAAFPDLYLWLDANGTIHRFHAGNQPGASTEMYLNRDLRDVFPHDIGELLFTSLKEAIAAQTIQEAEYSLNQSGDFRWFDARLVPIPDSNHALAVIRDVTARHRAEEEGRRLQAQLQHSQKLESLGVLAGGIAHDFNNILTAMMGYTDLALAELPADSSLRSYLDHVMTSARRAAELTQHMLAYSGKGQFVIEHVNLSEIVRDLGSLLQVTISKKAALRFQLDPHLPMVLADAGQLRQIVMNLLMNASDALGEESGVITLSTCVRWWSEDGFTSNYSNEQLPAGRYVTLEISDTGHGMDEETRVRIFDPFFSTKSTGRGLGLGSVLGIIRGHHGAIQVVSEPGKGSTFRVILPIAADAAPVATMESHQDAPRAAVGTVLIVDDESSVQDLAQTMLERAGFQVLTASDGLAALEIYRQHQGEIKLVLLDLTMPVMNGEETLRELRRINPQVRVILSSGYNETSAIGEKSFLDLAGFLQKPYRYRDLNEAIKSALARS